MNDEVIVNVDALCQNLDHTQELRRAIHLVGKAGHCIDNGCVGNTSVCQYLHNPGVVNVVDTIAKAEPSENIDDEGNGEEEVIVIGLQFLSHLNHRTPQLIIPISEIQKNGPTYSLKFHSQFSTIADSSDIEQAARLSTSHSEAISTQDYQVVFCR